MEGDWTTQDRIKCERCGKVLPGSELNIIIVHRGKLNNEWKDGRVVEVCNKCRHQIRTHKKEDNDFTDYVFKNKCGVLKEVRRDENGKCYWRNKK